MVIYQLGNEIIKLIDFVKNVTVKLILEITFWVHMDS